MIFQVNMFNGTPDSIQVMGQSESGELEVQFEIPNNNNTNFRSFSCHKDRWYDSLKLAELLGWRGKGPIWESTINDPIPSRTDYTITDYYEGDFKIVETEDAKNLAGFLQKAIELMNEFNLEPYGKSSSKLISHSLSPSELERINSKLSVSFLSEFCSFLSKGQFTFVYDD